MIMYPQAAIGTSPRRTRWTGTLDDRSQVEIRMLALPGVAARGGNGTAVGPLAGEIASVTVFGQVAGLPLDGPDTVVEPLKRKVFSAIVRTDLRETEIGIGDFRTYDRGLRCRCEIRVDAGWNERGLGPLLMRHLIGLGESSGMQYMYAYRHRDDRIAADLVHVLGFRSWRDEHDPSLLFHALHLARTR